MARHPHFKFKVFFVIFLTCYIFASLHAERIITLAPALTEIVYALGAGERLVADTTFCDFPPPAQRLPKIGGFLDLNLEILVALHPDILVLYPEHMGRIKFMQGRARLVTVPHLRLADLFKSIELISCALGEENRGRLLVSQLHNQLEKIRQKTFTRIKVRTLLIAGRNSDQLRNMFIVGKSDFLNDILEIAGGVNAYEGDILYPNISVESVVALNPEFIFEISAFSEGISEEHIKKIWADYPMILAVRKQRIKFIRENYWLRPGPRAGRIAEELYEIFYHD